MTIRERIKQRYEDTHRVDHWPKPIQLENGWQPDFRILFETEDEVWVRLPLALQVPCDCHCPECMAPDTPEYKRSRWDTLCIPKTRGEVSRVSHLPDDRVGEFERYLSERKTKVTH